MTSLNSVIARNEVTKQSSAKVRAALDCRASLAMTGGGVA